MRCIQATPATSAPQWATGRCSCAQRVPVLCAGAAVAALLLVPHTAHAHFAIEQLQPQIQQHQQQQQQQLDPTSRRQPALPGSSAGFDPSSVARLRARQQSSADTRRSSGSRGAARQQNVTATEALDALQQLRAADGLFQQGDYAAALQGYTQVIQRHPDLALAEYARLGQALCMYQEGDTSQALVELNELELDIRGNPETHAALAAVLYAERPAQRWRAEQQWDIALEFDGRYSDPAWVRESKKWPPRLMDALEKFLVLS